MKHNECAKGCDRCTHCGKCRNVATDFDGCTCPRGFGGVKRNPFEKGPLPGTQLVEPSPLTKATYTQPKKEKELSNA